MKLGSNLGKIAVTTSFNRPSKGNVWFLHGTSDTGPGFKSWIHEILHRDFSFKDYHIFYPTAPTQPYSLFDGKLSCVWYNRLSLSPDMPEDNLSIERTAAQLGKIIKNQTFEKGIPLSKVIIGGFSLGGSMALHTAYRLYPEIAGCFVLSSCIPPDSKIYDSLNQLKRTTATTTTNMNSPSDDIKTNNSHNTTNTTPPSGIISENQTTIPTTSRTRRNQGQLSSNDKVTSLVKQSSPSTITSTGNGQLKLPELFMSHGTSDPIIRYDWAKSTFSKLTEHGVKGHFYTMPNLEHSIHPLQLHLLHNWINNILDDTSPHRKLPTHDIQNSPVHPQSEGP